jgi:hypothetical protein
MYLLHTRAGICQGSHVSKCQKRLSHRLLSCWMRWRMQHHNYISIKMYPDTDTPKSMKPIENKDLRRRSKSSKSIVMIVGTLGLLAILRLQFFLHTVLATKSKAERAAVTTEISPSSIAGDSRQLRDNVYSDRWGDAQKEEGHCPWTTLESKQTASTRCDLQLLFQRLLARIPFSYVHFNDGEIRAMKQSTGLTDRGMQTLSKELQQAMLQAFKGERPGLVFGLPCPTEFKDESEFAAWALHNSSVERTQATLFINSNYQDSKELLVEYLKRNPDRNVHMVVSSVANITSFEERTGIRLKSITRVPSTNAFPTGYKRHFNRTEHHQPNDIVIICAGPLGRILGVEWFLQRPETTYLELGSYFDLELLGKSLGASYYSMDANRPNCGSKLRVQRDVLMALINATATDAQQLSNENFATKVRYRSR